MTSLGLTFEYAYGHEHGEDTLDRIAMGFERLGVEVSKWGAYVLPRLVPIFEEAVRLQFSTQGGAGGEPWKPLSEKYREVKEHLYPGQPTLVLTGKLRAALTQSGADGALRLVTPTTLAYGTLGVEYASYHQFGSEDKKHPPPRPEVKFGPAPIAAVREAVLDAIRELVQVSRLEALLEEDKALDLRDWEGPLTKAQTAAAKGRKTRIKKLQALRKTREGK